MRGLDMMRASLLTLALLVGCTGPRYPEGISGARLTPDKVAATIRHEYLVEYFSQRIATA